MKKQLAVLALLLLLGTVNPAVARGDETIAVIRLPLVMRAGRQCPMQIAFISDRNGYDNLYIMDADGSNVGQLTDMRNVWGAVWSPLGESLAFYSDDLGEYHVYLVNRDGSNLRRWSSSSQRETSPLWSPDGTRIAFLSGAWESVGGESVWMEQLWVANLDGTGLKHLVSDDGLSRARWSPDGNLLGYDDMPILGEGDIYTVHVDGSGWNPLTDAPGKDYDANWSPDGTRITFTSFRDGQDIYTMNPDGSGVARVTNDPGADWGPCWSPDGAWIAFASSRAGGSGIEQLGGPVDIHIIRPDGSDIRRLTHGFQGAPSGWSPDSQKIVYSGLSGDAIEIYVVDIDGSEPVNLTNHPANDRSAVWSP